MASPRPRPFFARARLVDLVEALEDAFGLLGRHVRARVVHASATAVAAVARYRAAVGARAVLDAPTVTVDAAVGGRVLERVFDQVVEHLTEAMRIAEDR